MKGNKHTHTHTHTRTHTHIHTHVNIFTGIFEEINIYLRYIDDIFFIWTGSENDLKQFI